MKKFLLFLVFTAASLAVFSQVPQGFNYQAIARDNSGNPIANATLWVRLSILSDTTGFYSSGRGTYIWEENHPNIKTNSFGMFTVVLGTGTKVQGPATSFNVIDWTPGPYYVGTKISQNGGSTWKIMGAAQLWSVPYSMVSAKADALNAGAKVVSDNDATADALFEVKRKDGQTVFAVYPDAVNIYVPSEGKGVKGGFAIGGFGEKAPSQDFFRVTPDSVRIYIDNSGKGVKGGFAIGGFDNSKGLVQDLMRVTPDSTRIYINNTPGTPGKGAKGGFAIGGFDASKGTMLKNYYMNISGTNTIDTVKGSPQVLWYPNRNAFLAGNVHIGAVDSVGSYSTALGYRSIAMGDYSQAFGYKAKAFGNYSTSIGKNSVAGAAGKTPAPNAFALGDGARATGSDSYAFGSGATATGYRSFAFGSVGLDDSGNPTSTPTTASEPYAVAIGMGAQATQQGAMALGTGSQASGSSSASFGYYSTASAPYSMALGYKSSASGQYAAALGYSASATGEFSTSIGYYSRAYGNKSTAIGAQYNYTIYRLVFNKITGSYNIIPITINKYNIANGDYSVAIGNGNQSTDGGITMGSNNNATVVGATAIGHSNSANAQYSFAAGVGATTNGYNSVAIGENVTAQSANSFVIGVYNTLSGYSDKWHDDDPLFVIGNGDGTDSRHDAFIVHKNGYTKIQAQDSTYGLYVNNLSTNYSGNIFGIYSNPKQNKTEATGTVYGLYTNVSNSGKGTTYGSYNYVSNNSSNTTALYSGYFYSYSYGSGTNYGLRSTALGSISSTGSIYSGYFIGNLSDTKYQGLYADKRTGGSIDVAEYIYDTNGNTEPADVVVADPNKKESVIKSSKPYQTSVVGVISTKPHLTIGMELIADEKTGEPLPDVKATRLALSGRVPVNVTGENGPIKPGDYLTTSSTPGFAMKWSLLDVNEAKDFEDLKRILTENERRRGAIIGKAVESFPGTGTGKIIMLISLQ
ncbi:MAG TPA: hypothetical protein PLN06_00710 [Bacteroidales bacterium]|nr:hypothetical protein [Bacteroidales bacterium]HQG36379.1 hypothetical protein [Bacteroidales bacterium]HQJ21111.1 hypothetical protein [Bacteroidales bacterium]